MPSMCGAEATKKIRDLGFEGVIIGVTGNVLQEDADDFKIHGADAVMTKPFDASIFQKILEEKMRGVGNGGDIVK